jgi:hypothetical protein
MLCRFVQEILVRLLAAIVLSLLAFWALAQEPGKAASTSMAEFNMAIATVMKTPVTLNSKGKTSESFCKRPDVLTKAELKKLQLACEKIFSDTTVPEIQRAAAKYILGKTKTQYISPDLAERYCDEASPLLGSVADFYDDKNIPGNGPHEAMTQCLISTERYFSAIIWVERGIKRKETSQMQYLAGRIWQNLQELKLAQSAFERAIALDKTNEAARKSLTEMEGIPVAPR